MLGVGLAWLLGWSSDITSGQMTGDDDDDNTKINWEHHCVNSDNGWQITSRAIRYDANPECSEMKFKEGGMLGMGEPSVYYVTKWLELLELGLLSDFDTKRIATMMNNCRRIHSLDAKTCPNDLEKDSLLYAIDNVIDDIEKGQAACQRYIVELEKLTKSVAGKEALSSRGSLDLSQYKDLHNYVRGLIQTYSPFHIFYFPVLSFDWANDNIKKAFETWKPLIKNSTVSNIDLCAQKQLRHFLYEMLRLQVMLSSLLKLSNPPLSAYSINPISNDDQKHIDDILKLNIAAMIKNMPADEAAEKVRKELSDGYGLKGKSGLVSVRPDYLMRLSNSFPDADDNNMVQFTAKAIQQLIDDLKKTSEWSMPLLDKIKQLQAQFNAQLTNTTTTSSIHECVEYLTTNTTTTTVNTTNVTPSTTDTLTSDTTTTDTVTLTDNTTNVTPSTTDTLTTDTTTTAVTPNTTNVTVTTTDTLTDDTTTVAVTTTDDTTDTPNTSPTTPHNTMSSSASPLKSSWMPNSPIFHILISSLFWTRLAHLLGLSH
ncbi:hypothetical protein NEHOM01_1537 [Nematocida homosporus]|uniref:uncharacterized protein n=1 Tax=Nematocida homosporus TaxID=1912981 RepID=UPI00221FB21D|nr:uncharacterized protein NEHOM01_1537 [Nematocida homosporus]KAI5186537.1 hypothetical protein NEHOM01_1537 [Nematocida homosporus]